MLNMLNKLPLDILEIIFNNIHYGEKYKFYLINNEIRNLFINGTKKKNKDLACKIKFYSLINITSNFNSWNKKEELLNMNYHYLNIEEYYNIYAIHKNKNKKSFNEYFQIYYELYEKKDKKILKKMKKFKII